MHNTLMVSRESQVAPGVRYSFPCVPTDVGMKCAPHGDKKGQGALGCGDEKGRPAFGCGDEMWQVGGDDKGLGMKREYTRVDIPEYECGLNNYCHTV